MLILLVVTSFIALAATGHIILYDGSWELFQSLSTGHPIHEHGRIPYIPFYWLHLLAAQHGWDVPTCAFLFGLSFDVFTAAVLCGGLWICRNRPVLLCGLLAGPFVGCLPAQIHSFTEATHVGQLGGVLILLASFASVSTLSWIGLVFLPFLFFSHPFSSLAFFAMACVLALRTWWEPKRPGFFILIGALLLLCAFRASWSLDPYEQSELTLAVTIQHFRSSFWGLPLVYVSLAWVGIAWIGLRSSFRQSWLFRSRVSLFLSYALLGAFAVCAFVWAKHPGNWIHATNFRRFSALMALAPSFVCACIQVVSANRKPLAPPDTAVWVAAGITIAGFAVALQVQGWVFNRLCRNLRRELLAESRILTPQDLSWSFMTPLRSGFLPVTAILVQGKEPHSLIIAESNCKAGVPLSQWEILPKEILCPGGTNRFFSFAPLSALSRMGWCLLSRTKSEYDPELSIGVEAFWVKHRYSRFYTFVNPSASQRFRIRFSTVSLYPDLPVQVVIAGDAKQMTTQLVLRDGSNSRASPAKYEVPLELPTGQGQFEVRFECDAQPGITHGRDTRKLVFLVRDFRIDTTSAVPVANDEVTGESRL
jgi:hypothetical protein